MYITGNGTGATSRPSKKIHEFPIVYAKTAHFIFSSSFTIPKMNKNVISVGRWERRGERD
jgi:hypothetical protein